MPQKKEEEVPANGATENSGEGGSIDDLKQRRISWAKLLAPVFDIDMQACELCGGRMKAISAVMKADVIENDSLCKIELTAKQDCTARHPQELQRPKSSPVALGTARIIGRLHNFRPKISDPP